jgi:hypothetical protein
MQKPAARNDLADDASLSVTERSMVGTLTANGKTNRTCAFATAQAKPK